MNRKQIVEHVPRGDAAKRRAPQGGRSAGRPMNSLDDAQLNVDNISGPAGSSSCRPRVSVDLWGQRVVAPVMPGDVVVPSNIYPRE